jgi:hypothetical protein
LRVDKLSYRFSYEILIFHSKVSSSFIFTNFFDDKWHTELFPKISKSSAIMVRSKKIKVVTAVSTLSISSAYSSSHVYMSSLLSEPQLRYKLCVLIYNLRNVSVNQESERQILRTIDELYISHPYFTETEAASIKAAMVNPQQSNNEIDNIEISPTQTIEQLIKSKLANFFEERIASGDLRPCGPHDLAPIYQQVFGIETVEVQSDQFLGWLHRNGLNS